MVKYLTLRRSFLFQSVWRYSSEVLGVEKYYWLDDSGLIHFSDEAQTDLSALFAKAGIAIESIKTEKDYLIAREKCSPYFMEWMNEVARTWPNNPDFNLLRTALFDSTEAAQRESVKLRRSRIKLV